jgi:hypothetical protein
MLASMFEAVDVRDEDLRACAEGLGDHVRERRLIGATRLARAAHWADLHAPVEGQRPSFGGDGTPAVTQTGVHELGLLLQTTTFTAAKLMRDALDLRHRHPRTWRAVMTGCIDDYVAAEVARRARAAGLSLEQARRVDDAVVEALSGLSYGRAMSVVDAQIIAADPAGHQARLDAAAEDRYVAISKSDTSTGLRTLIARTTIGDVARFDAMVAYIADVLASNGDTDPQQVRRAKAFALLADPARACLLLARGVRGDEDSRTADSLPAEPDEPAPPTAVTRGAATGNALLSMGSAALDRLRPRSVFYVHVSAELLEDGSLQVVRLEDLGPMGLQQLIDLLGGDRVILKPVVDLRGQRPVDAYEVPARMREAMIAARPYEVWPWGTLPSRRADLDHTVPYCPPDEGGPPGQTRVGNLGPLSRSHHMVKTSGDFTLHQPLPGVYLWRSPSGYWFEAHRGRGRALGRETPPLLALTPVERRLARLATADPLSTQN